MRLSGLIGTLIVLTIIAAGCGQTTLTADAPRGLGGPDLVTVDFL